MFLWQKFNYKIGIIDSVEMMNGLKESFVKALPKFMVYDTETTGLNNISDTPFILTFGWEKQVYMIDLLKPNSRELVTCLYELMALPKRVFAHNAKYDYHMMTNYGMPVPAHVALADSQTIARLTNYCDEEWHKDLETMGTKYVDETAKFAGKVIKTKLNEINKRRKAEAVKAYNDKYHKKPAFGIVWEAYGKRIPFIVSEYEEQFNFIDTVYKEANYLDIYKEHPTLMYYYAIDDCVIMLEWLPKALPVLNDVDPTLNVFNRECKLIRVVAKMERVGFKIDVNYLLESRLRMVSYKNELYEELYAIVGEKFTVGQHEWIRRMFARRFRIVLGEKVDNKELRRIESDPEAKRVAFLIRRLRTVDKWISTYVDGALKKVQDGRIYTGIDNAGTVSGRVSSNLQQQPKEAFCNEAGEELFHPRKHFINDDDYALYFFDFSQQELRVQAYYTILVSGGDKALCRAYMPFKCISLFTGEPFDFTNREVLDTWDSGEWVLEEDPTTFWTPLDVHCVTTHTAFPEVPYVSLSFNELNPPLFKVKRKLGKVCNFLKNYQGGIDAIMEQLDVTEDVAEVLDKAYYKAFPDIRKFQKWVTMQMHKFGFVENLYGRRYYMRNSQWFYRVGNYLVQGSSADMIKTIEIELDALLEGTRSSFVMSIHDEVVIRIHLDELYLVPIIKAIMEDVKTVPYVPMVSDVEYTLTNWADKRKAVMA